MYLFMLLDAKVKFLDLSWQILDCISLPVLDQVMPENLADGLFWYVLFRAFSQDINQHTNKCTTNFII